MTEYERALMSLDEAKINNLFAAYQQAKAPAFSGGRKFDRGTMGIAAPQDVQFAEQAKAAAPHLLENAAHTVASFAPGSGEYISARQSTEDVAKAREAINNGDYASAAAHGLESVINAVGSIPIAHQIMALGKGAIGVAKGLMGAEHIIPAITTYHGTPTSGIRKWDLNFRGTGEGRLPVDSPARESFQDMIGHGLYSAEKEGIAKGYQERLAGTNPTIVTFRGKDYGYIGEPKREFLTTLRNSGYSDVEAVDIVRRLQEHHGIDGAMAQLEWRGVDEPALTKHEERVLSALQQMAHTTPQGALYTTELTSHPDEFLLWDKPLSEQSEKVQQILEDASNGVYDHPMHSLYPRIAESSAFLMERPGEDLYKWLRQTSGSDKAASEYLHSLGIRGIKYEDGNTRGKSGWQMVATKNGKVISDKNFATRELAEQAGKDLQGGVSGVTYDVKETASYNYVTFNPAEEAIITHENGKRIPGAVEEAYRKLRDPESKALFEKKYPELKGE